MSPTIQIFVVCTVVLLAVGQSPAKKNPFLVQQKANHQHLEQQKRLRQVQQEHQNVDIEFKPVQQQPQQQEQQQQQQPQPAPPSERRATRKVWRAPKTQAQQSPFSRNDRTAEERPTHRPRRNHGVHSHNRNEMHKSGGSTWSRYTEKPNQQNPWGAESTKQEMAECQGKAYNPRERICCQGVIQKRQGLRPACCGTVAFDFVFNLCCDDVVTPRSSSRPYC